ncbi:fructose-1,6-bisphosphate aldolase [Synechocystis sp. PCC 6803]|nr:MULTISPECIES: fructose bisphosphate aldolase [unclassified Synechocystis]ALJ68049.1 fructose-1,6-bisphosphate aldolase [Synechocystis sp. PCC 6803]BAM54878.1 fructose-1,6-bisphosphate aldolase [Synechocystis sp. PCC 6803] [Bacillus subtilis BEST7613]
MTLEPNQEQLKKMKSHPGFIAALDQSGGSTPGALADYGIEPNTYSGDDQMFALVHQMRTRIMTSPGFTGDRILAAILFEDTMNREVDGEPTANYLWQNKQIVPILKVDKGLAQEKDGSQLMKPIPQLDSLLMKAKKKGIFGTKMRSFIKHANPAGIEAIVDQQFELAQQIIAAGLVPIIEPEVDIHCSEKAQAEALLKQAMLKHLNQLPKGQWVMLKLTLPEQDNLYSNCIEHANVLRVVALSGGYSQAEANERLSRNHGVIASFSRALTEGLTAQQTDAEFNTMLDESIEKIYQASIT